MIYSVKRSGRLLSFTYLTTISLSVAISLMTAGMIIQQSPPTSTTKRMKVMTMASHL